MPRFPEIASVLHQAGLKVVLEDGWETRGSADFDPVGILNHHTAGGIKGGDHAELAHVRNDNLAQLYICRRNEVHLIACGRSAHAGLGLEKVRDRIAQDLPPLGDARDAYGVVLGRGLTVRNRDYWGCEVENNGLGEPYPDAQIDVLARMNAAICRWRGWTANRVAHHRESTSRKIDMSYRGDLRGLVALALGEPAPVPVPWKPEWEAYKVKPTDVVRVLDVPGGGLWQLTADGGIRTLRGTFHGSYPGLPAKDRQGERFFVDITERRDKAGYVLWANDGNSYAFPTS